MSLREALVDGSFVVTGELGPPAEPDAEILRAGARALAPFVNAANATDNQAATVKMSAIVSSALMLEEGLEPILQLTGRDRNLLALQSELIGAWAIGVRTVLALSGDPLAVGPYAELATKVGDLDSIGLARLITGFNQGRLAAGESLQTPTDFLIAGAANPLVDSVERVERKLDAGVGLLQTNIVYDIASFARWMAPLVAAGITERAPLLVGVTPPRSLNMLSYMHAKIPGVEVDAKTFARMAGLSRDAARAEGIRVAAEVIEAVREIEGVAGVHIMAPGWEVEAIPDVVRAAGVIPPTRAAPQ